MPKGSNGQLVQLLAPLGHFGMTEVAADACVTPYVIWNCSGAHLALAQSHANEGTLCLCGGTEDKTYGEAHTDCAPLRGGVQSACP